MGIKPNFTKADISRYFNRVLAQFDEAVIYNLSALGEECRNDAIMNRGYTDQTGNLVSSIGYVIVANGSIKKTVFETKDGPAPGERNGEDTGRNMAESLASQYPSGYAIVVVAGMDYASAVESRGRNVLTSAETLAIRGIPELKAVLLRSLERMNLKTQ